jgi:glycosyltransferase involved in cell wall biosynthesis
VPAAAENSPERPRIAVVFQGNSSDLNAWSGMPAGLSGGLGAAGADPVPIDARMPAARRIGQALRMSWISQATNPLFVAGGGLRADLAIRSAGIDAAVTVGSGFSLRSNLPTATFDDMTVSQGLAQPDSQYSGLGAGQARRWRRRQLRNYRRATACCVSSEWAAASVREDYGIDPAKVHVVGFGRNSPAQTVDRDWSVPRFLFIGIEWERKQGQAVVEAFERVRERYPEASLDLVGGHPPIDAPGVSGHGILSLASAEDQERKADLLARATCLVLPSKFEPFGIAHVDAAASGVPSIGTTTGGTATAIGEGGILVDPADHGALLEAMLTMCDPITARRLGKRAFSHSAGFTWQGVAERVISALALD